MFSLYGDPGIGLSKNSYLCFSISSNDWTTQPTVAAYVLTTAEPVSTRSLAGTLFIHPEMNIACCVALLMIQWRRESCSIDEGFTGFIAGTVLLVPVAGHFPKCLQAALWLGIRGLGSFSECILALLTASMSPVVVFSDTSHCYP